MSISSNSLHGVFFSIRSALYIIVCYLIWAKALLLLATKSFLLVSNIIMHLTCILITDSWILFQYYWTFCYMYKAFRFELYKIIVRILIRIVHEQWWNNMHAIYFLFVYACNIYSVFILIFNTGQKIWRGPNGASICQSEVGY